MERIFPTFCHINDYLEEGYGSLHQMIASSFPLVLWGPSGSILEEYYQKGKCLVSPEDLIRFVEQGWVQIIGRERWLLDERFRQEHSWEGAKWIDKFDGALKRIWLEQQRGPESNLPVRIVEEEDGHKWADEFINNEPSRIFHVWRLIRNEQVPQGSLERAQRYGESEKEKAVHEVLRDARNHARAYELAEAKVPFFLQNDDKFFKLLEAGESSGTVLAQKDRKSIIGMPPELEIELGSGIYRLLDRIEHDNPREVPSLHSFLGSEAHREFAEWLSRTTSATEFMSPQSLERFLLKRLKEDIEAGSIRGNLVNVMEHLLQEPQGKAMNSGIAMEVARQAIDPGDALGIGRHRMNVVRIVTGISQELGMVNKNYKGPRWPFLYRWGRKLTKRDIKGRDIRAMKKILAKQIAREPNEVK